MQGEDDYAHDSLKWRTLEMIQWRNEEIQELSTDMSFIADTMDTLASMVHDQGMEIEVAVREVEKADVLIHDATHALERASHWQDRLRGFVVNGSVVLGAAGLGCAGFIAGPIVGTISLTAGLVAAIAFVGVRKAAIKN